MTQGKSNTHKESIFNEKHEIFTQNRKVSPRQIRRAMTLEIFGISSLCLPSYLAKNSGIFGVAAILVGAAGVLGLLCVWEHVGKWADENGKFGESAGDRVQTDCSLKENALGKRAGACLQNNLKKCMVSSLVCTGKALCGIGFLALSAYVLALLTSLMRAQLLNDRYEIMILLTLSGAGFFGLCKGLESRIRIYEVLFWFLLVPLVVILIVASVSVMPVYWRLTEADAGGFVRSCLASFLFFAISSLVLLFRPHCREPERAYKSVCAGVIVAAGLDVAIYLILLGVFGQKLLANLEFPVILLMAVVKLPGEFFERQDALMVGIWFFCLFALFDSLLYYGKELVRGGICRRKNRCAQKEDGTLGQGGEAEEGSAVQKEKEKRNGIIWSAACTLAVFVLAFIWR